MADEEVTPTQEAQIEPEKPAETPASLLYGQEKPEESQETSQEASEEGAEAAPEASEEGGEPENAEAEEVELSSLDELAEHFELDPEWMQNLKVKTKVNGQAGEVPLAELVGKYQQYQAGDAYLKESKEKARAIVDEANQQKESVASTVATFSKLLESVESEINRDVKNIDWNKLREDDPAEYSAKKTEIAERRERLEAMKREAGESYQQAVSAQQEQLQQKLAEQIPKEQEKLVELIPEFGDAEKGPELKSKIASDLESRGFTKEEIAQVYDSRLVGIAHDAMLYRQGKSKSEAAKKKVVKVPKVLKPGPKSAEKPKTNGADKDDPATILYG